MKLYFRNLNQGNPLFILHGLYGASDNWLTVAKRLDKRYNIIIPDLRNHGQSPHSPIHDYPSMAEDIKELADSLGFKKISIIGHSMGGKLAMTFACMFPEYIEKLVVIDIAPKDYNSGDFIHHIESHKKIMEQMLNYSFEDKKSRREIDHDFASHIKGIDTRGFILKNIKRKKGEFLWKINIRSIYNNISNIMENPLKNKDSKNKSLKEKHILKRPVLFIKGENSDYMSEEDMGDIKKIFPIAELVSITDCDHWIHTEQPEILVKVINNFLK